MNLYDAVAVTGAPGYENFTGCFLGEYETIDGRLIMAVGYEIDGKRDFVIVPSTCVSEM